jgi:hypothetical protein
MVALAALVFASIMIISSVGLFNYSTQYARFERRTVASTQALQLAEAAIDKAVYELNQNPSYSGETDTILSPGTFTISVTNADSNNKRITATAYVPDSTRPLATRIVKTTVNAGNTTASFHYGVQSGNGGFILQNNSFVKGNIYANGDVLGSSGTYATGTVIVAGGTSLTADQQHTTNNADYAFGQNSTVTDVAQSFQISADNFINKISLYIRKTGSPSNKTVYILTDNGGVPSKTPIGTGTLNASSVTGSYSWVDVSFSTPPPLVANQTYWLAIDSGSNSSNYFWLASDVGNTYGNGIAMYSASWNAATPIWTAASRDFDFKIWTGGVDTKIDSMRVYETAKAHRIEDSEVNGDAYYQEISNTTVDGTSYPGSADPGPQDMPISDGQIDQWKETAENGGVVTGDATYSNSCNVSLGPVKITGNLSVSNNCTLTITGVVYVVGDVNFSNNVIVKLASSYGANSGMIVVDGKVDVGNNITFQNSGTAGSYILVLSTNTSVDSSDPAIDLQNNGAVAVFYAAKGMIKIANNTSVKEITAFKIYLDNNASVEYEVGLANVNFYSGPGASWEVVPGSYVIVQ